MKICIIGGGGAIGGFLAVQLARSGNEVTVVARGKTLSAILEKGLTLISEEHPEGIQGPVRAVENFSEVGVVDLIILAIKAHQLSPIVNQINQIVGPETVIIPMQNGIPFWYFQRQDGPYQNHIIETVDPQGLIMKTLNPNQIIGCVVYPAAMSVSPGVIKHVEGVRFPLGELDGAMTERIQKISAVMTAAGFKSPILEDIRSEIWLKLWGNLTFNPISALTHGTLLEICQHPKTRELAKEMMTEAQNIAHQLDVTFRVSIEKRIDGAEKVGRHKTSMLQDVEAGRELEVDALLGSVIELGKLVNVPTARLETVYALTTLLMECIQDARTGISLTRPGNQH
ncbi:MAG: 2-dehydropantoate 2-reductase [Ferrovum sp. 37-45-19]|uniref:2-dehydropantoate 2-reductase n=1 Tax=Ferrovum sp. JA12 TaxID=1356299 RepID=UPI0007032E91|nr:2-dehydropantoate 2-reductase [Ferrovum sp. JA12]KRH79853.1 2-dehydropantoate 2-reductase [Ferrovum sp. JA12]OYV95253.1 MAG: 2-dehydropantoate 2-reductase [Ferrovum sp. 37-45-19]HQT80759.1 2-dehydropantoate 2-reductase [Ferrovaceae bacterium]